MFAPSVIPTIPLMTKIHPGDRADALAIAVRYLATEPERCENEFRLRTATGDSSPCSGQTP